MRKTRRRSITTKEGVGIYYLDCFILLVGEALLDGGQKAEEEDQQIISTFSFMSEENVQRWWWSQSEEDEEEKAENVKGK